jgi:transcriptional regulator with XRE-family HTH domain
MREPRTWGEHLRRQRILRGISQPESANEIGVSEEEVWRWEAGKRRPSVPLLPRLIEFLGYCPYDPDASLKKRLTDVREALGLTRREVARRLGVDDSTVSRWESGERRPPAWYRRKLLALDADLQLRPTALGR